MVNKKLIKHLLLSFLLFSFALPVFAVEEYVSEVYKEIDSAFSVKSDRDLNIILQENNGDKYYYLMENYATKKVRRLIITNDYEFAMEAILVIIDNNLDNTDAIEMYATISDAYELQKQKEELEIQRQRKEQERLAALKEGQRASAEKQYNTVKDTEGKTVFSTGKDGKLTSTGWNFNIGVNPAILMNTSDDTQSLLVGAAIEGQYYRAVGSLIVGGDIFGNFHFLNIPLSGNDSSTMYAHFELFPKISVPALTDKLFFKLGMVGILPLKPNSDKFNVADTLGTFITPALGVDVTNINLGKLALTAGFDYYAGHLWTDNLNFAMGAKVNFAVNIAETATVRINLNIGAKDVLYIKDTGIENRINLILAVGVQNVTK